MYKAFRLLILKRLSGALKHPFKIHRSCHLLLEPSRTVNVPGNALSYPSRSIITAPRNFCSRPSNLDSDFQAPTSIDYRSLLQEDEFHRLANSTIHDLQEKFEEYGDAVQIDGFDVDYGNEVLTLKLGALGTYVLNKQTPNRQIWLSSPVSGPSRFDWDWNAQAWIYRRTKANLLKVLESELEQLCGEPISLS
ncbi:putative Frataxin, mitochondrial [Melia azedarach]|uniref:Frataxin, mitochondrial n=2 Tax=Melia azedarach TaxID=155640 RepID=A0ACC1Z1S7_MELAZ|nr:putative Frataxin, mitochondrial [Melia azedarach]KAJ4729935.1 putative Frataxin, mitochondrial [Melia azedarach]